MAPDGRAPRDVIAGQQGVPGFWDRWLTTVLAGISVYGAVLVVRGAVPAAVFDQLGFGMTAGGITGGPAETYVLLIYGILGAVLIGWMLLLLAVVRGPLLRRERWAWHAVSRSLTVWFLVDTAFSVAIGFPTHALFNVGFALAACAPLVALGQQLRSD